MNIERLDCPVSSADYQINDLNNKIESVKPVGENKTDPEKNSIISLKTLEGLDRLSPVNQYRFYDGQTLYDEKINLKVIPGNPQKTLALANKVINEAVMPPIFSNPSRNKLSQAIQLKHHAQSILDKAA
jgi:hypothetical protein